MTTPTGTQGRPTATAIFSTRNKVGLGLAALLGVSDLPSLLLVPEDGVGPPVSVQALATVLGVVTIVAVVVAFRARSKGAVRVAAAARIASAITALPAFFVDPPPELVVIASLLVLLTAVAVVLMLTPPRGYASVTD